jgi:hypothetical protein
MTTQTKWANQETGTIAKQCLKRLQASVIEQMTVNALVNDKLQTDGIATVDAAASVLRDRELRDCSAAECRRLDAVDWQQVATFVLANFQPVRQPRDATVSARSRLTLFKKSLALFKKRGQG